jgi:O-antigen ligase
LSIAASSSLWRDRPLIARLGRFGALTLLVLAPAAILFFRHSPPFLALLLLYFLTVPLFWSVAAWPPFMQALRRLGARRDVWIAAGFLLYCVGSALLSPARSPGLIAAAQMAAGFGMVLAMVAAARFWPDERLTLCMVLGVIVGAALLIQDLTTGLSLRASAGLTLRASDANRTAVYGVLAIPVLLHLLGRGRLMRLLALVALPLAVYAAFVSFSSSAALALAAGCAAYGVALVAGRRGVLVLGALACLSFLLMPWLAGSVHGVAPDALWTLSAKNTMEPRAIVWEGFARLIALKPVFGYGFEASAIADRLPQAAILTGEMRRLIGIGHPHNIPIQVWFELGAVGALWAVIGIWLGVRRIADAEPSRRPMLAGLACAVYAVSVVSHGAWQVWWPLMIAMLVVALPRPQAAGEDHAG